MDQYQIPLTSTGQRPARSSSHLEHSDKWLTLEYSKVMRSLKGVYWAHLTETRKELQTLDSWVAIDYDQMMNLPLKSRNETRRSAPDGSLDSGSNITQLSTNLPEIDSVNGAVNPHTKERALEEAWTTHLQHSDRWLPRSKDSTWEPTEAQDQ